MRSSVKLMLAAAVIGLAGLSMPAMGQGSAGNRQPGGGAAAQLTRIQTALGATDEDFAKISPLITAVTTARTATQVRPAFGGGRPGAGGGGGMPPAPTTEVGKAAAALQTVLDNKDAKPEDIKAALTTLRDAKKKADEDLKKAEAALTAALLQRQEAVLVEQGILE